MKKEKNLAVVIKKLASLEKLSPEDILKRYKYFFNKYNLDISSEEVEKFKSSAIKSIKRPFKIENN